MSASLILGLIGAYFALLFIISWFTSRNADESTFFRGNKASPWYLVAFGMIGASLSGVTFISVPGWVGSKQFAYMQMVLGYLAGYAVIALVLMPLYYKLNLTSIYKYLEKRFGRSSYKTGAAFFLISRILGASFRMYLVALVLDGFVMREFGIPFAATVAISIGLIWVYTFRGGIKTVVWTDTLQTLFMLLAAGISIYFIADELGLSGFSEIWETVSASKYSKWFFTDFSKSNFFVKEFLGGAFIAIVMTGLDQDMMQKNLTCKTLGDAQKNMYSFSIVLVFVNLAFLVLGALLFIYGFDLGVVKDNPDGGIMMQYAEGWKAEGTDKLFPFLAINHLPKVVGITFIIGLIASAYSSADSALTALTTSFCIDFLDFEEKTNEGEKNKTRQMVHIGMSVMLFIAILIFKLVNNDAVIGQIFTAATYTYGPLLGLYAFGLFTRLNVNDKWVPIVCILSPVICYLINTFSGGWLGFSTLMVNGALTFIGLLIIQSPRSTSP